MPINSEPMNLKDAFAYMNFLTTKASEAAYCLRPSPEQPDSMITSNKDFIYDKRVTFRYSKVNSELQDSEAKAENMRLYNVTADQLVAFLDAVRLEKESCALAIAAAKKSLPRDLDVEISLNKERHELLRQYRALLDVRNVRVDTMDRGFKFDNDGRQTAYSVPVTITQTISFDREDVRRRTEELTVLAKSTSSWIDRALVTTEVDFTPRWSANDSFEAIVASAGKSAD